MNKIGLFVCSICFLLSSCGEADKTFDFKKQGGVQLTIQVPISYFMEKLTREAKHEGLEYALEKIDPELSPESYIKALFEISENGEMPFNLKSILAMENEDIFIDAKQKNTNEAFIKALLNEYDTAISKTVNILETRLINFQISAVNSYREAHNIIIEVPGAKDLNRIRKLLQSQVDVGFYTPYSSEDAIMWFQNAEKYSLIQEDSVLNPNNSIDRNKFRLFDHLMVHYQMDNLNNYAEIGHAKAEDTARISQYLNKIYGTYTPLDSKFVWGYSKVEHLDGNYYNLYYLQNPPKLKGDIITKAIQDFDYSNRPCLTMYFNQEGTEEWGLYTEERVGKYIAIVVNNSVYSAPMVNEKIPGGVTQISGNMEVLETKDMANILNAGTLPYHIIITEEEITGPSL